MKIHFSKKAFKSYQKLPESYSNLIDNTFTKLITKEKIDIVPIEGSENIYRLRVGRYRIIIEKLGEDILIASINTKGDVYKK